MKLIPHGEEIYLMSENCEIMVKVYKPEIDDVMPQSPDDAVNMMIEVWKEIMKYHTKESCIVERTDVPVNNCLCKVNNYAGVAGWNNCVVKERTFEPYCKNTPGLEYSLLCIAMRDGGMKFDNLTLFHKASDQVIFLRSLLSPVNFIPFECIETELPL